MHVIEYSIHTHTHASIDVCIYQPAYAHTPCQQHRKEKCVIFVKECNGQNVNISVIFYCSNSFLYSHLMASAFWWPVIMSKACNAICKEKKAKRRLEMRKDTLNPNRM